MPLGCLSMFTPPPPPRPRSVRTLKTIRPSRSSMQMDAYNLKYKPPPQLIYIISRLDLNEAK